MTEKSKYCIARICLTDGTVETLVPDADTVHRLIGGRGLGMKLLCDLPAEKAPLLFMTGPLTDAPVRSSGRYCAVTRSPVDGMPVSLNSGSGWGIALKRAGWDGILLEGEAPEWMYLSIDGKSVRLHSAQQYVGFLTDRTTAALKARHGDGSMVLCVGPAGENRVPLASVICNTERAFGRHGIGMAMGTKRLKAIVVCGDNPADMPENACSRCPTTCRHAVGTDTDSGDIRLYDQYGLDAVGASAAIAALRAACRDPLPEDTLEYRIRQISQPNTLLAVSAGAGAESPVRSTGTEREKVRRKLPEELAAVLDSMGCCLFAAAGMSPGECAELLGTGGGNRHTPESILQSGAEICRMEQSLRGKRSPI